MALMERQDQGNLFYNLGEVRQRQSQDFKNNARQTIISSLATIASY